MPDDQPHDPWADHYDCVYKLTYGEYYQGFTDLTLKVIRELAAPPAGIVDFGAGTGRLAIPLAQMGYKVTAVEASAGMCRVLRAKAAAGVEGAVEAPCVRCQGSSVPIDQRHPVKVAVSNQSICEPLAANGFDLGLCVFTVLNYIPEEKGLRQFASVAASAIRPGGKLLLSFDKDMAPMMDFFNGKPKKSISLDGRCGVERNIQIRQAQGKIYDYHEESRLTKDGRSLEYEARILLREWSRAEITQAIEAAGFSHAADVGERFGPTGEVYLLFGRVSLPETPSGGPAQRPAPAGAQPPAPPATPPANPFRLPPDSANPSPLRSNVPFRDYFRNEFSRAIEAYRQRVLALHPPPPPPWPVLWNGRIRNRAFPVEPIVVVEPAKLAEPQFRESNFWHSWYVTTLLNEAFVNYGGHHSMDERNDDEIIEDLIDHPELDGVPHLMVEWNRRFGAFPLPMVGDMGGWHCAHPLKLLQYGADDERRWLEVCLFVIDSVPPALRDLRVDPVNFFERLLADPDFQSANRLERILAQHLRAYCDAAA